MISSPRRSRRHRRRPARSNPLSGDRVAAPPEDRPCGYQPLRPTCTSSNTGVGSGPMSACGGMLFRWVWGASYEPTVAAGPYCAPVYRAGACRRFSRFAAGFEGFGLAEFRGLGSWARICSPHAPLVRGRFSGNQIRRRDGAHSPNVPIGNSDVTVRGTQGSVSDERSLPAVR